MRFGFCDIQNNQGLGKGYVFASSQTGSTAKRAGELDMITRDLESPWHDNCVICSYDVTGADFENPLYAFGQSEKS